jgi:hypothetical protein
MVPTGKIWEAPLVIETKKAKAEMKKFWEEARKEAKKAGVKVRDFVEKLYPDLKKLKPEFKMPELEMPKVPGLDGFGLLSPTGEDSIVGTFSGIAATLAGPRNLQADQLGELRTANEWLEDIAENTEGRQVAVFGA